jgi:hypothetical protein
MKTIENLPKKYKDAIDQISDERMNGDGFWIYLKAPYFNDEMESKIIHEQRVSDCIKILKHIVSKHGKSKK